jgi:hypothetical protein
LRHEGNKKTAGEAAPGVNAALRSAIIMQSEAAVRQMIIYLEDELRHRMVFDDGTMESRQIIGLQQALRWVLCEPQIGWEDDPLRLLQDRLSAKASVISLAERRLRHTHSGNVTSPRPS